MALSDAVNTLQGLQGLQMNQANMANAERQRLQQEQQAQSMKIGSDHLRKYQQSVQDGTPDYNALNEAILIVPELADNVLKGVGIQDKAQKQMAAADIAELVPLVGNKAAFMQKLGTRVNTILERGGNPQDTIALAKVMEEEGPEAVMMQLRSVGNALEAQGFKVVLPGDANSGKPTSQAEMEYYLKLQQSNPEAAAKFAKARSYVETEREQSKTEAQRDWENYQQLKRSDADQAQAFGQKVGFVSKEGRELSAHLQKRLSTFSDAATTAATNIIKFEDLASQFDAGVKGGLISGSWGEYFKDITGNQDWKSELRRDFAQVRSSEVIRILPPGVASDRDIEMALKPFPTDNASGEQVAGFLRGMSKLAEFDKSFNEFKAGFVSEHGTERGMVEAWKKHAEENSLKPEQPKRELGKKVGAYTVVEVE